MSEGLEPPVGALGEEAVRLLHALQDWARDTTGSGGQPAEGLLGDLDEHSASAGKDCQYCPVCQLMGVIRATSPEVKHHVSAAASSLLQAAAAMLAPPTAARRSESDVERIDLDSGLWEDD